MRQCIYKSYEDLPLVLSAKELSSVLCISRSGAYALMKSKGFPSFTVGNRVMVSKAAFKKWLDGEGEG